MKFWNKVGIIAGKFSRFIDELFEVLNPYPYKGIGRKPYKPKPQLHDIVISHTPERKIVYRGRRSSKVKHHYTRHFQNINGARLHSRLRRLKSGSSGHMTKGF